MTTKQKHLQTLWKRYEREHDHMPASAREAVEWALAEGELELPEVDPVDVLAGQMAKALRDETAIDDNGNEYRVNHAIRVKKDHVQHTLWGSMKHAPRTHIERAFGQRREQIISDCVQLKRDVDVYNKMNPEQEPVQLVLDFTEDVAERQLAILQPVA